MRLLLLKHLQMTTNPISQFSFKRQAGAELVFLPIYARKSLLLTQAEARDYADIFGCDGLDGILTIENFDTLSRRCYASDTFADATDEKQELCLFKDNMVKFLINLLQMLMMHIHYKGCY